MKRGSALLAWLALAALVGALVYLLGYLPARHPGFLTGSDECEAAYRHARTAADTAMVDAQRPVVAREKYPSTMTCGALRRSGQVRHAPTAPPPNESLHPTSARHSSI